MKQGKARSKFKSDIGVGIIWCPAAWEEDGAGSGKERTVGYKMIAMDFPERG